MRITLNWLEEQNACEEQCDMFEAEFGLDVEVCHGTFLRALDLGLDLDWLACDTDLLTEDESDRYHKCERVAWDVQELSMMELEDSFERGGPTIGYRDARLAIWRKYEETMAAELLTILEARE